MSVFNIRLVASLTGLVASLTGWGGLPYWVGWPPLLGWWHNCLQLTFTTVTESTFSFGQNSNGAINNTIKTNYFFSQCSHKTSNFFSHCSHKTNNFFPHCSHKTNNLCSHTVLTKQPLFSCCSHKTNNLCSHTVLIKPTTFVLTSHTVIAGETGQGGEGVVDTQTLCQLVGRELCALWQETDPCRRSQAKPLRHHLVG